MPFPTLHEENKLYLKGYQRVVGLDESRSRRMGGSQIAAAVLVDRQQRARGSRLEVANPAETESLCGSGQNDPGVGIGIVEHDEIDRMGIVRAKHLPWSGQSARCRLLRICYWLTDWRFRAWICRSCLYEGRSAYLFDCLCIHFSESDPRWR